MPVQGQAGDIVRMALRFTQPYSSAIENVWHFILDGTGNADADDIVSAAKFFADAVYTVIDAYMVASTAFEQGPVNLLTWIVDKWLNVGDVGDIASITGFTPAAAGDPLPDGVAALTRYLTAGPRRTGSKYFGPFGEGANDTDGGANSTLIAALTALNAVVLSSSLAVPDSALTLNPVVLSPTENVYHYPEAAIARAEWAYQRRRKSNRGI